MTISNEALTAAAATSNHRGNSQSPDPQANPAASASPAPQDTPASASASTDPASSSDPRTRAMGELRPELYDAVRYVGAVVHRNSKEGADYTLSLTADEAERIGRGLTVLQAVIRSLLPALVVQHVIAAAKEQVVSRNA